MIQRNLCAVLCAAFIFPLVLEQRAAHAQTWLNAADGLWTDSANWSGGTVPINTGFLPIFDATGSRYTATFTQSIDNNSIRVFQDTDVTLDLGGFSYRLFNTNTNPFGPSVGVGFQNAAPSQPARLTLKNGAFRPFSVTVGVHRDAVMTVKSDVDWQDSGNSIVSVGTGSGLTATLNVEDGPATTIRQLVVGTGGGTTGHVSLDREFKATEFFFIGNGSTLSTVTVNDGAMLSGSNTSSNNTIRPSSMATVMSGGEIELTGTSTGVLRVEGVLDLQGGTVNANYLVSGDIQGSGNINGNLVSSASAAVIRPDGGTLDIEGDFIYSGNININPNSALQIAGSSFTPRFGGLTEVNNGVLHSVDGFQIFGGQIIRGHGVVIGNVSGSGAGTGFEIASAPNGTVDLSSSLDVSSHLARVFSSGIARLRDVTIAGGTLQASNGARFAEGDRVDGHGTIAADVELQGGLLVGRGGTLDVDGTLSGSGLLQGDITSNNGTSTPTTTLALVNNFDVGSGNIHVYSQGVAQLGPMTNLAGGTLVAPNGISIDGSDTITGAGFIEGAVSGSNAPNGIQPSQPLIRTTAYDVGSKDVYVLSSSFANLGPFTKINGGTANVPNGLFLPGASLLQGNGTVNGKIAAGFGSTIQANGALTLGDVASAGGYFSDGELQIGANIVTINDADEAVLGSLTTLGDGTNGGQLIAGTATAEPVNDNQALPPHFLLEDGKSVTGRGSIAGNFRNMGSVVGDGTAMNERIEFEDGYTVTGIGFAENVLYSGAFNGGLSPGIANGRNLAFGGTVQVELGGTSPGLGSGHHDQIVDDGSIALIGGVDLEVLPWEGFEPELGDEFEILRWDDGLTGAFDDVLVDPFFAELGLHFSLDYQENSLLLVAIEATTAGDFNVDGVVSGADFLAWQRGESPNPSSGSDLDDWQSNYRPTALEALSTVIPEPGAWSLAMVALMASACRKRRTDLRRCN